MNHELVKSINNKLIIKDRKKGKIFLNHIGINKSVYFVNITGCDVFIDGKINNIFIEKCDYINIYFDSIINKFDVYNSGKIFLHCKVSMNLIVSEQTEHIKCIANTDFNNLTIITMSTYQFEFYSALLQKYLDIKYSMFSDRYQTTFDQNTNPVYASIKNKLNLNRPLLIDIS